VRRRIWFALTAVMAASLAVGVGMAVAAAPKSSGKGAKKAITLRCTLSLTTEAAPGSNTVDQPASQGSQYGPIHCSPSAFGGGIEGDSFTVPDSGDTNGQYRQYFNAGSIKGAFTLTPQEANFGPTAFANQTWAGTVTITGGTGVYKGIKGKKGTGVLTCTSPDSVHLSCTEKIKVRMP
jgi:hypothetical protein